MTASQVVDMGLGALYLHPPGKSPSEKLAQHRVGSTTKDAPRPLPTCWPTRSLSLCSGCVTKKHQDKALRLMATAQQTLPTWVPRTVTLDLQDKSRPQQASRMRSLLDNLKPSLEVQPVPSTCSTPPTHRILALLHRPWVACGDATLPVTSTHYLPHAQGCTGLWGS